MNTTFEQKRQASAHRTSRQESQHANAFPSRTFVQAKLEMTEPGDHDEREADAVANAVIGGEKISRQISGSAGGASGIAVSKQMESQLSRSQGGGRQMPEGLRSMMESGFGRDFSQVRLHTDSDAASMSGSIRAKAFTHGNDIYFNQGQFSPETTEGQRLVAHELTHVVQGTGKVGREAGEEEEKKGIPMIKVVDNERSVCDGDKTCLDSFNSCQTSFSTLNGLILHIEEDLGIIIDDLNSELTLENSDLLSIVSAGAGVASGIAALIGVAATGAVGAIAAVVSAVASVASGGVSLADNSIQNGTSAKNNDLDSLTSYIKKEIHSCFNHVLREVESSSCEKGDIVGYTEEQSKKIGHIYRRFRDERDDVKNHLKSQILAYRTIMNTPFHRSSYYFSSDDLTPPVWNGGYYLAKLNGRLVTGSFDENRVFYVHNPDFEASLPQGGLIDDDLFQSVNLKEHTYDALTKKTPPFEVTYVKRFNRPAEKSNSLEGLKEFLMDRTTPHESGEDGFILIEKDRTIEPEKVDQISRCFYYHRGENISGYTYDEGKLSQALNSLTKEQRSFVMDMIDRQFRYSSLNILKKNDKLFKEAMTPLPYGPKY